MFIPGKKHFRNFPEPLTQSMAPPGWDGMSPRALELISLGHELCGHFLAPSADSGHRTSWEQINPSPLS